MTYLLVVIGLVIMGAMIFLAFTKKTDFKTKIASLIALGVMILTVIICMFIVLTDSRVPVDESDPFGYMQREVKQEGNNNIMGLLLAALFLIAVFVFIVILAMRENRKNIPKKSSFVISAW